MHYRWSWPLGIALLLTIAVGAWTQAQLAGAATDARVMVRDAHDTVAGVQDLAALAQPGARAAKHRHLRSDPCGHAPGQLRAVQLPGRAKAVRPHRLHRRHLLERPGHSGPASAQAALDAQAKFGLPRTPLIANVHFPGQAAEFEALRQAYRTWLDQHRNVLAKDLAAGQADAASALSTGSAETNFAAVVKAADAVRATARSRFDDIWQNVYFTSTLDQGLALALPRGGSAGGLGPLAPPQRTLRLAHQAWQPAAPRQFFARRCRSCSSFFGAGPTAGPRRS